MKSGTKKVVIIDYKLSNLFSVKHACEYVGLTPVISSDKEDLKNADGVILPGVGAFGDAVMNLEKLGLIDPIKDFVGSGKPFLGICLGLQLLFTESEEFGNTKGLGLIAGKVRKFSAPPHNVRMKVPHIGWNKIYSLSDSFNEWGISPLSGIADSTFMYFVHSYYVCPDNKEDIITSTNYSGFEFCSAIKRENIFATQFHPEKSANEGIKVYYNWLKSF